MSILGNFGETVKEHRNQLGLSQERLAELCNLHRTYIGAVERGERNVSLKNIVRIASALGITSSELLYNIEGCAEIDQSKNY
ncbi:hypothetical protein BHU72_13180 [Desulfuribacillus stibiiarsenatis]|uniref:HTH cro/C1-type domain-containing protein n=1 Tax=Desulfuribacillus stibiiarsenatis TaxID=1390249 RepID=A0A1E5L8V0_9FIRM|nr:helix-turn-helix transcriptional regulator [Desulfuribacillus stibiiarsenatis]OEH86556.1 hypothetical protein BHU72_13180 [Desulfuribacillus stibiiarsenatis]